jgi:hypothetical protein
MGLSLLAGVAASVFAWPPWYDLAPVIPLAQRFARAAIAVASGTVVTAVALDLLAGFPLVRWFFTWTHNLAIKGRAKSPVAAWRELWAAEQASTRWRARRSDRAPPDERSSDGDVAEPRYYANVRQEHREHGDEDAPMYGSSAPTSDEDEALPTARARSRARLSALAALDLVRAELAVTPASNVTRRAWLLSEQARLLEIAVQFARAGPGDGRRLGLDGTRELLGEILEPNDPV